MSATGIFRGGTDWVGGVVGLGYVGLPLLVTAVEKGIRCIGFDADPEVVQLLSDGVSHVDDISVERIAAVLQSGLADITWPQGVNATPWRELCRLVWEVWRVEKVHGGGDRRGVGASEGR